MKKLTPKQVRQINALVRAECCNYFQGYCDALDTGEPIPCPQIISQSLLCLWFQKAVLPINEALYTEIFEADIMKHCISCGLPFHPGSNRAKYCKKCAEKIRRKKEADRLRKFRARKK